MTSLPKASPSFPALSASAPAPSPVASGPVSVPSSAAISYANVSKAGLPAHDPPTIQTQQPTPLIPSQPSPPPDARTTLWFGDLVSVPVQTRADGRNNGWTNRTSARSAICLNGTLSASR